MINCLIVLGLVAFLALQTPTNINAQGVELGDGVGDRIHARYTEAIAISVNKL